MIRAFPRPPLLGSIPILLAVLAVAAPAMAAGRVKITIDELIAARVPADLCLSPDGARLAYTVRSFDSDRAEYVHQIHVQPLSAGKARQYTFREAGAVHPRFSPDGAWIAFLGRPSAAPAESGETAQDDAERAQVFALPVDGGEAKQLTRFEHGAQAFEWLPNGAGIVVLAEEETGPPERALKDKEVESKNDAAVELGDRRRQQFWIVELKSGDEVRVGAGVFGIEPPFSVAPDGASVAYAANLTAAPGGGNAYDLYVLDVASGTSRRLTDRHGAEKAPRFSPDGRQVAFVAPATAEISYSRPTLFVVPATGGTPRPISARSDRDLEEEGELRFAPDGRSILAVVHRGTDAPIWRFDMASGEGSEIVGGTRVCSSLAVGRSGALAFVGEGPAEAPEIYTAALDGTGLRKVTDLIPQAREWAIGQASVIRWAGSDGKEVEGILVTPPGYRAGTRVPLLVYPHGGPQWRDPNVLLDNRQAYAAEGYALLLPEYRGSTGYGDAWAVADMKDLGGGDFRDIMAGVDKVIAMGVADPARLGIFGGSYGGYLTNWAITQTDRFKGAVSWYGIWNLVTDFSNSFYLEWEPDYLRAHYWDDWELYLSRSPARYVTKVKTPVLILHGEDDDNTSLANSREMWTALRALGKPVEFVHYPREGHGFMEPNHQKDVFRRTLRHMDRYVKGGEAADPRPGETVTAGGLELLVAGCERRDDLAGRKPKAGSLFLAVTLVLKDARSKPARLSLKVGGAGSEAVLVDGAGRASPPAGALATALGESLLFAGEGELAVVPDGNGEPHALPVVLVFEVREGSADLRLKVKDFRAVRIDLPPEGGTG